MIRFMFLAQIAAAVTASCVMPGCVDGRKSYDPTLAIIDARAQLYQDADNIGQTDGSKSADAIAEARTCRSNAIEALAEVEGAKAGGVFMQALKDKDPMIRFAAAMAIGDTRYAPALNYLKKMADPAERFEPDKRVFCAVIYALHKLGNDDYASELGTLLFDPQQEVRADVALVMGKMGEESAIEPLNTLLSDEREDSVKLVIVESLALLGDQKSASMLETHIKRRFIEDQLIAINAMAKTPTQHSAYVLYNVMTRLKEEVIVRCAAAGALAKIGHPENYGYELCVNALQHPEEIMREKSGEGRPITAVEIRRLQQVAAMSLGDMGRNDAVAVLLPVLKSDKPAVRIAAARSILKLLSTPEPKPTSDKAEPENIAKPDETAKSEKKSPEETKDAEDGETPADDRPRLHTAGGKD